MHEITRDLSGLTAALDAMTDLRFQEWEYFATPDVDETFNYIHEEVGELWRVYKASTSKHLRNRILPPEQLAQQAELEWGEALMMLFTAGWQMGIDPVNAYTRALQTIYQRCATKRSNQDAS